MASQHINIQGNSTRLNSELRSFVDQVQRVQDLSKKIKGTYDQTAMGADWEALRVSLGLETVTEAEDIYNLIGSVQVDLDSAFINQMLGRLG